MPNLPWNTREIQAMIILAAILVGVYLSVLIFGLIHLGGENGDNGKDAALGYIIYGGDPMFDESDRQRASTEHTRWMQELQERNRRRK